MDRALREFRIRGVATNLTFLENRHHPPEVPRRQLHDALHRQDAGAVRAGHAGATGRPSCSPTSPTSPSTAIRRSRGRPRRPAARPHRARRRGSTGTGRRHQAAARRARARRPSPTGCATRSGVLVTDTTMRDAHQSLLATRMRTHDIVGVADAYARALPQLLSLECWGGATFDVAMRFLDRRPVGAAGRHARAARPTSCCRCCCAAPTASATPTIPTMSSSYFVAQAAAAGIDLFRVFDCLNWVENMRVAMDAVRESGQALRSRDLLHRRHPRSGPRPKYDLKYYVDLAQGAGGRRRPHPRHQGHGRAAQAGGGARCCSRRCARRSTCRSISTPTTPSGISGGDACWRRSRPASTPSTRRWTRCPATPRSPTSARSSRRCATDRARPASTCERIREISVLLGGGAQPVCAPSRATCAPARRRSICTRCRAASSPISRSRRARSGWRRAGTRSRRPMPTSTMMFGDIVKVTPIVEGRRRHGADHGERRT